jgi:hypothetical protein
MQRVRYTAFAIYLNGIRWSGRWCIVAGELQCESAYGYAARQLGRRKPDLLAEELLLEILAAKLEALEAEQAL